MTKHKVFVVLSTSREKPLLTKDCTSLQDRTCAREDASERPPHPKECEEICATQQSRSSSCSARARPSTPATRYPLRMRRTRVSSPTQARRHRRGTSSHPGPRRRLPGGLVATKMCFRGASGKSRPAASRKCAPTAISASRRRRHRLRRQNGSCHCSQRPTRIRPTPGRRRRLAAGRPVQRRLHRVVLLAE